MKKLLCDSLLAVPMLLVCLGMIPAFAVEVTETASETSNSIGQVTSVTQLSDIQPSHWSFQALESLVERYGCIASYPDDKFQGNRAITRYEFAAALSACLDKVNELIATSTAELTTQEDLDVLRRLQEDFSDELVALRGRVDKLEARTEKIEAQQFSTTTKLSGEGIFAVAGVFGDKGATGQELQDSLILGHRARLAFTSSFTGKDQLRIRLQGRNISEFSGDVTGTNMTRLSFAGNDSNVTVDELYYRFPLSNKTTVSLIAAGYGSENIAPALNPLLQSDGSGAVSRFGRFSPLYRLADGPGVGVSHKLSNSLEFSAAYRAKNANNPSVNNGLFDGNSSILAQLTFSPSKNANIGLTYVNAYFPAAGVDATGGTGSAFARKPFGDERTATNSYGAVASVRVNPKFTISGWAGMTQSEAKSGVNAGKEATALNWAVTLGFPDLGKKGNLGGIIIGMPPKVTENEVSARQDKDTSLHVEALYRHQINNNIAITPGVIVIFNPEHKNANDPIYAGVLRTTFRF